MLVSKLLHVNLTQGKICLNNSRFRNSRSSSENFENKNLDKAPFWQSHLTESVRFAKLFVKAGWHVLFIYIQTDRQIGSFTLLHETEAGTRYNHKTLNFLCQDGSSLQIVVQLDVLDRILLYHTHFQTPRRRSFQVFLYEREAGSTCDKGLLFSDFLFSEQLTHHLFQTNK